MRIYVVILTFNEESNIGRCLSSLRDLAYPIYIVDSGSTDQTVGIAESFSAIVLQHAFTNHTTQWKWALENIPQDADWILALDADQRITDELRTEIPPALQLTTPDGPSSATQGFYLNRRYHFRKRWLRWGGVYPKYLLKLFRREFVRFDEADLVDHHFYVVGATRKLKGNLIEENSKEDEILFWIQKHIRYADSLAREELLRRQGLAVAPLEANRTGSPDSRILWLKQQWRGFPLYTRSIAFFIYRYFLRLGFFDGKAGFVFHFMQALWFRLLVDVRVDELTSAADERQSGGPGVPI